MNRPLLLAALASAGLGSLTLLLAGCQGEGNGPAAPADAAALGQRVYANNCRTCHQATGLGVPGAYPTLAGTEWVNGDKGRLVRLTLSGLRGPITVDGKPYNNVMTAHAFLSDDQLAAVLTYVRSNFGNAAGPVTPAEVAAVRAANERDEPWTAAELQNQTGIPAAPAP